MGLLQSITMDFTSIGRALHGILFLVAFAHSLHRSSPTTYSALEPTLVTKISTMLPRSSEFYPRCMLLLQVSASHVSATTRFTTHILIQEILEFCGLIQKAQENGLLFDNFYKIFKMLPLFEEFAPKHSKSNPFLSLAVLCPLPPQSLSHCCALYPRRHHHRHPMPVAILSLFLPPQPWSLLLLYPAAATRCQLPFSSSSSSSSLSLSKEEARVGHK